MTEQEAYGQAYLNGKEDGYAAGYLRGAAESSGEAEWIYSKDTGDAVCSNCGLKWYPYCMECGLSPENTSFCPGCGKKMRKTSSVE